METLRRKTDEFEQITGNMQEGLVLLSHEGDILSINPTAKRLFGAEDDCIGKNFLMIDRSSGMRSAVKGIPRELLSEFLLCNESSGTQEE